MHCCDDNNGHCDTSHNHHPVAPRLKCRENEERTHPSSLSFLHSFAEGPMLEASLVVLYDLNVQGTNLDVDLSDIRKVRLLKLFQPMSVGDFTNHMADE